MWANSRSPCAAWFRFMKSMSISPQGRSRLNCVCRWRSGFERACRPAIHIFAGENVCIQAMTPTHASVEFASRHVARIASAFFTTGFQTTRTGIASAASSPARDLSRVLGNLPKCLLTVQVLAPRHEPDLEFAQRLQLDHSQLSLSPCWAPFEFRPAASDLGRSNVRKSPPLHGRWPTLPTYPAGAIVP